MFLTGNRNPVFVSFFEGFAYWDRRTIIRKSTDEAVAKIEKEGKLSDLINAFRDLSKKDQDIAEILRKFNLL